MSFVIESLEEAKRSIDNVLNDSILLNKVDLSIDLIAKCFSNDCKVVIAGNGGSACDAMHFAEEFTGRFKKNRKALPVISLTDPAFLTCVANDFGYDAVFQRGVEAFCKPEDIFIGISTSGNSENIFLAIQEAKKRHVKTISFLGKDGGKAKGISDIEFIINSTYTERIQEIHMLLLHIIIQGVEFRLFPE